MTDHPAPADQQAITALVTAVLPALDFGEPEQAIRGDRLLELANHVGAAVEYDRLERKENEGD